MKGLDTYMQKVIANAHNAALDDFRDHLDSSTVDVDMEEAFPQYKSIFIKSILDTFYPTNNIYKTHGFSPLLNRLSQKGIREYSISTDPLRLTVMLNGAEITFSQDCDCQMAYLNGENIRVGKWEGKTIDILEAIHAQCQEKDIKERLKQCFMDFKSEKVKKEILKATIFSLAREELSGEEHEIMGYGVTFGGDVYIHIETSLGPVDVMCPFEEFEESLETAINERGNQSEKNSEDWVTKCVV